MARLVALSVLGIAVLNILSARIVDGCAPAWHLGDHVDIAQENALIVWDQENSTEHFIRNAQFVTDAADFGFLVPTPTEPKLAEVPRGPFLFRQLERTTAAEKIYQTVTTSKFRLFSDSFLPGSPTDSRATPSGAVEVLQQVSLSGYDAAVLRANDSGALTEWLAKHNYATRPALTEWLQRYVENEWVITAFKLSRNQNSKSGGIHTDAVRMSFQTDKPFYPYREPIDMREGGTAETRGARSLRVFFLAGEKHAAQVGDTQQQPAEIVWANHLTGINPRMLQTVRSTFQSAVEESVSEDATQVAELPETVAYLTEFLDKTSPRAGTDELYFLPAKNQDAVERPLVVVTRSHVNYWPNLPFPVVLVSGILTGLVVGWKIFASQLRNAG